MKILPATTCQCTSAYLNKQLGLEDLLMKLNKIKLYAICTTVVLDGLASAWTNI